MTPDHNLPVDLAQAVAGIVQPWSPLTVALLNDYDVRVVKVHGEFVRHSHLDTDELFLVIRGEMSIQMDSGKVDLTPGQLYVVPRGVAHQPVSLEGADVVLIEPSETVNTGDNTGELTAPRQLR